MWHGTDSDAQPVAMKSYSVCSGIYESAKSSKGQIYLDLNSGKLLPEKTTGQVQTDLISADVRWYYIDGGGASSLHYQLHVLQFHLLVLTCSKMKLLDKMKRPCLTAACWKTYKPKPVFELASTIEF